MSRADVLQRLNVSRETTERLDIYDGLLNKWNPAINLVARSTLPDLWSRHFLDSAQLLELAPAGASRWADLGTGGGFPGLIVAILAAEARPDLHITCVESDQRKATFLRSVVRETGISATIRAARVEEVAPLAADILSARALAPLPLLLSYAERHLAPGGTALFQKGAAVDDEIAEALATFAFRREKHTSKTNPESVILAIGEIHRV